MISRRTSSIPKEYIFPRLLYSDSTCSQVLPGAPEGHYISSVNSDPWPGRREECNSPSEGMRFGQSRPSHPKHRGVSDGNWSHSWCVVKWLPGLVTIQRTTVSCLGGLCIPHLMDPVQQTIWTACSSHWEDFTGIATALYGINFAWLGRLKYWSQLT